MNEEHLRICGSQEWAELIGGHVVPWVLERVELGDDVLEVGPGPGLTTDVLREQVSRLTVVEIDPALVSALADRLGGTNVEVRQGDGASLPFGDDRFTGATCFTMLHHVPSRELQDRLLAELRRVVQPGGVVAGSDSVETPARRALHVGDVYNPIKADDIGARLEAVGLVDVQVDVGPGTREEAFIRFRGSVPA